MIAVVSGLPRSGTSLAMQMLAAGGFPILTDAIRQADQDNQRGYFEWEPVKRLASEPGLIDAADGKAVKVISALLPSLPRTHEYRVVFIERPASEVAASQGVMIGRRGTQGAALTPAALVATLDAHRLQTLRWLEQQHWLRTLRLQYHAVLRDPARGATKIASFLEHPLDTAAMAAAADPAMRHQHS